MKNIFLDTNVLMDILANRQPFYKSSAEIYKLGLRKKVVLFTSSNTISTLHYLLKKFTTEAIVRRSHYCPFDNSYRYKHHQKKLKIQS
jgi:predicted nucleic acid-binding protein